MAHSANDRDGNRKRANGPEGAEIDKRLEALDKRLGESRADQAGREGPTGRGNAMAVAVRAVSELVVGVLVGGAIGWGLDWWLGTSPFMLLIFFLLGFAAGTMNVVRATSQIKLDKTGASREHKPSGSKPDSE